MRNGYSVSGLMAYGAQFRHLEERRFPATSAMEGTIPGEAVSHCQACGEPVELGLEWCDLHKPAADLWQALNPPIVILSGSGDE